MKQLLWIAIAAIGLLVACKKDEKSSIAIITTTTPSSITANSAQTGGDITNAGGSPISQSGICWAFQDMPTVGDSVISSGQNSTGSFTISLTNLNANTTYYVRAFAINNVGTAYGVIDSFTTAQGLATVTTTAISNIVPLTAYSGGNVTNNGGSPVTARGICWSTSANPTVSNFKTSDSTGTGSFTDSLTDLASQTQYYVRAYATNSAGTSYGNQITFTSSSANTVTDIDGNVYPYVLLGTQSWTTMNLKTTHYQNGDPIINGLTTGINWNTTDSGAYTFPNGDSTQNKVYGKLYNTFAVNDTRNVCPLGWHIPSDAEWETLEEYEGMPADSAMHYGYAGTIGPVLMAGGSSGLNLQNAGYLFVSNPSVYYNYNTAGFYYSSTMLNIGIIVNWYRAFDANTGNPSQIERNFGNYGMSVRCIKD